jgi:hypothetical protein
VTSPSPHEAIGSPLSLLLSTAVLVLVVLDEPVPPDVLLASPTVLVELSLVALVSAATPVLPVVAPSNAGLPSSRHANGAPPSKSPA